MTTETEPIAITQLRALHRVAVLDSAAVVALATGEDLERPTPCGDWVLDELLRHMAVQHHGFAAAASGRATLLAEWHMPPPMPDPIGHYAHSVEVVLAAFADDDVLGRRISLPEVSSDVDFSASQVLKMHLIDSVVHTWDVARTLGKPYVPEDELGEAALRIALRIPNGPERQRPGAAFAPGSDAEGVAPVIDRIVTLLGRSPAWPA